jgi:hypothetical protein
MHAIGVTCCCESEDWVDGETLSMSHGGPLTEKLKLQKKKKKKKKKKNL